MNGREIGLPPRKDLWIDDADVSYDMQLLINKRVIINRGGKASMRLDPFELPEELKVEVKPQVILLDGPADEFVKNRESTSSDLQVSYDNLDNQDESISDDRDESYESTVDEPIVKKRGRRKRPSSGE